MKSNRANAARAQGGGAAAAGVPTVNSPSRLLRAVNYEDAQDESPIFCDCDPDEVEYLCTTFWLGLVSGKTYVCYSERPLPTSNFFRSAEQREMLALEESTVGGMH